MKKIFSLAILAILCCILATSCSKENGNNNENKGEVTLIGTWRSYCIEELGEYNEVEGREYTKEYTVVFTDTEATMVIEEMPDGVQAIVSTYEFKENDNTIIYFNEAYQKYIQSETAKLSKIFANNGIDNTHIYTDIDYVKPLMTLFKKR